MQLWAWLCRTMDVACFGIASTQKYLWNRLCKWGGFGCTLRKTNLIVRCADCCGLCTIHCVDVYLW
ncbi:MAG TPA: hypothetical protein DEF41_07520 [Desulfovibrio sp.]|uniref:Uncharacterized protein n=1 Tax=Nitratidesulfovibrio vulgaris (strain ATCC 29579 / DSM 644 / CCUG 34227 / NCIMB 8303 / VKM B-1760 / Hildenborough) TaxID=882 RepID=Q728S5_NITV2|nr:hypothetical protein DVU_2528 [Nitratidesulfovibrio vulgaris str. Hildenborough]HBW15974.1 hypothetical protein [Desulfovibrio sp.]